MISVRVSWLLNNCTPKYAPNYKIKHGTSKELNGAMNYLHMRSNKFSDLAIKKWEEVQKQYKDAEIAINQHKAKMLNEKQHQDKVIYC